MNDPLPEAGLLPAAEAARRLRTTPLHILMHIKRGNLAGREIDGTWWVEAQSLERLAATGSGGPSPVCPPACGKHGSCSSCG